MRPLRQECVLSRLKTDNKGMPNVLPKNADTTPIDTRRRRLVLAAPIALAGCVGVPNVSSTGTSAQARATLEACAQAHGLAAWQRIKDISVSYDGEWYDIVQRVQPVLVDAGFRKSSQERLLLNAPVMAQQHTGPSGSKFVLREGQNTQVWRNASPDRDAEVVGSAALVADAYRMFLTGPFGFLDQLNLAEHGGTTSLDDRPQTLVLVPRKPGFGWGQNDSCALYVDQQTKRLTRARFTIDALASTRGAVVEVDFAGHRELHGVQWPTQFFERIRRPIPMLPAHKWWMTGLDINRGFAAPELQGGVFRGAALAPAQVLR